MKRIEFIVGVLGLLIAVQYLARTEWVLGGIATQKMQAEAQKRGLQIEVGGLRPNGLWGVALTDVAVSFPNRSASIEAEFETVTLQPSFSELMNGRIVIESVEVAEGTIAVVDGKTPTRTIKRTTKSEAPKARPKTRSTKPSKSIAMKILNVDFLAARSEFSTERFRLTSLDVDLKDGLGSLAGYGSTPDGVAFTVSSKEKMHEVVFESKPDVQSWSDAIPIATSTKILRVYRDEDPRLVFQDLTFSPHEGSEWSAAEAIVKKTPLGLELSMDEISSTEVTFGRLTETRITYESSGKLFAKSTGVDTTGGKLRSDVRVENGIIDATLYADHFDPTELLNAIAPDLPIRAEGLNGTTRIHYNANIDQLDITSSTKARSVEGTLKRLSPQAVKAKNVEIAGQLFFDFLGRSISIVDSTVKLEASEPILVSGRMVHARDGVSFYGTVDAPKLNAIVVRDALPNEMTEIAMGGRLNGDFGFNLKVGGHSAYPKSLHIDGDLVGAVNVERDSPRADVLSLASAGAPSGTKITSQSWVPLKANSIPSRVVLAAEDAAFFKHRGFDWAGFQRAMIHNLEKGALERGASTITQQVVKNLYLDPNRTVARKLQEAYLTWRIESVVSKERILEIYLNIATWGPNIRGIVGASKYYYDAAPTDASTEEIALLAAILPNPARFGGAVKRGFLPSSRLEKIEHILANLRFLGNISYERYRDGYNHAKAGKIGRLQLTVCDDGGGDVIGVPKCEFP